MEPEGHMQLAMSPCPCLQKWLDVRSITSDSAHPGVLSSTTYPLTACPFPHVQGEYAAAVQESSVAVELNPTYVKALMRRCQAQEHMDKLEEALAGEEGSMLVRGSMCGR